MVVFPDPEPEAPAQRPLLVLEQTPFPVELLDREGRVIYGNRAYFGTFHGSATAAPELLSVLPDGVPEGGTRKVLLDLAQRDGLWKGEMELGLANGRAVTFRISIFPIRQPQETFSEFAVFYEDIQKEIETRAAMVHQQNLLAIRSRQAQMGELLSMIAHQWRQPLTVVMSLIGNIQLKAQMGALDPKYLGGKLDRISQTVHFLSETIDSFRNFYAPAKYKSEEDLAFLTRRAYELLSPSLRKLGTEVQFQTPEMPVKVRVFAGELVQVALELITNARDALLSAGSDAPFLRLVVLQEGNSAVLRVENNGAEIPPEILPHIYDPYYTTKEGTAGTGLGLYMAKLIVETHHNGTLTATSADGWTSFTCVIPWEGSE